MFLCGVSFKHICPLSLLWRVHASLQGRFSLPIYKQPSSSDGSGDDSGTPPLERDNSLLNKSQYVSCIVDVIDLSGLSIFLA